MVIDSNTQMNQSFVDSRASTGSNPIVNSEVLASGVCISAN